ncbi:BrnT family toxin [Janthinobacterium lividum]|uniref:BrnT family toxin n=1 Tax=Janthinobacterium lividum TaxID=29581 RepID=A0A5C4NME4_9BURK|nr:MULTISPECIES: BrnT family toxin [Janthinobacterium]KAB8059516.1 ADP-ribosyl-(dinitrogen reductase) hydrolase [Janthinobacterium sp. FT14W]TNC75703.1 BrnT family toxin [Janthinobacterium lividum]
MRIIVITPRIDQKLDAKHDVTPEEVDQCFDNKCGVNLIDEREDHKSDPPSLWFIAETNKGRLLKIIYVYRDGKYFLKSAFEPGAGDIDTYENEGK